MDPDRLVTRVGTTGHIICTSSRTSLLPLPYPPHFPDSTTHHSGSTVWLLSFSPRLPALLIFCIFFNPEFPIAHREIEANAHCVWNTPQWGTERIKSPRRRKSRLILRIVAARALTARAFQSQLGRLTMALCSSLTRRVTPATHWYVSLL